MTAVVEPPPTLCEGEPPRPAKQGRPSLTGPMIDMADANPGRWVQSGRRVSASSASAARRVHPEYDWVFSIDADRFGWLYVRLDPSRNPR